MDKNSQPLRVLIVEDSPADAELVVRELRRAGFEPEWQRVETEAEFSASLDPNIDIILSDYAMPQFSGLRALELVNKRGLEVPFIIVSGTIGEETAVEAIRSGATDYLLKDRLARLGQAVEHALTQKRLRDERKRAEDELRTLTQEHELILNSAGEGVHGIDLQGKIIFENPKGAALLGWKPMELIGLPAHATMHHTHADGVPYQVEKCPIYMCMRDGETRRVTNDVFWRKDGSCFRVDYVAAPVRDESGKIRGSIVTFKDITEQFAAEQRLKLQEQQYRLLFQTNPNPMWVFDSETLQILAVNEAAISLYGYSKAEFLSLKLTDLRRSEERVALKKALSGPKTPAHFSGEFRHKRKDGSQIDVEIYSSPVVWDGATARMVTAIDITERKHAEEELTASQRLMEGIIDAIPVRVFWKDKNLSYLGCNAVFARDAGLADPKEIIGKDDYQLGWRDQADLYRRDDREVIENGCSKLLIEEPQTTPEGKTITLLTTKIPLRNSSGEVNGVIGAYMDITERKQAEERLGAQADIIDRAHDAIIIREFESDAVTFWNAGAELLYGWTASEAIGQHLGDLIFTDSDQRALLLKQLASTGEYHGEIKHRCKDGREVIVDTRTTLIRNDDGTPRAVLGINSDVTEKKKLEMQLMRAQRLESIGTLASGVAHDLNNVLTPILMCAEVLQATATDEESVKALSLIEGSARRGAAIVKQVLTFARGIEGERVLIKPSHLIEEMIDIARKTFPKSIDVSARYSEDLWSIEGDPTQLHQVLLNLSVNARDAMPNGGRLVIWADNFEVDEYYASMIAEAQPGPYVALQVSDTGTGMPRAVIDKIFDPFFTTKEADKGTGLGLSTTLGIVKSHGGFISVHSEIGSGTTFKIFLPAQVIEEVSRKSATHSELWDGQGELILVVDDEPNILSVTKMILQKHNYGILDAHDGPEALAVVAQQSGIKVVLTDISMPYMDGVAVVRAIKKMKPDTKFIASTGQGEETRIPELQSLGVISFLTKPYDTDKLLHTLRTAIESKPNELA